MKTYFDGYIFIDGELKTFKPLKYQMQFFPQEECICTCKIGVGDSAEIRTLDVSKYDIYNNEYGFKSGCVADGIERRLRDVFRRVFGFYPLTNSDGSCSAYEFKDGEAKHIDVSCLIFYIEITDRADKYTCVREEPLYESCEKVYLHNDYIVDGEVRVSPKSKLALNDEQKKYLEQFKQALKNLKESNVKIVYEASYEQMLFVNENNIDSFTTYDPDEDFIEIADVVECVDRYRIGYINHDNCESLYAKLK